MNDETILSHKSQLFRNQTTLVGLDAWFTKNVLVTFIFVVLYIMQIVSKQHNEFSNYDPN